ncbi:MAG: hypothetical protein GC131_00400 [Alphaproteobacteria bacterium]|nr:hypothetical protein [Alphaproteobacteria bacterium]
MKVNLGFHCSIPNLYIAAEFTGVFEGISVAKILYCTKHEMDVRLMQAVFPEHEVMGVSNASQAIQVVRNHNNRACGVPVILADWAVRPQAHSSDPASYNINPPPNLAEEIGFALRREPNNIIRPRLVAIGDPDIVAHHSDNPALYNHVVEFRGLSMEAKRELLAGQIESLAKVVTLFAPQQNPKQG